MDLPPIIYPIAVTMTSTNPQVFAYINFLKSATARPAFEFQSFGQITRLVLDALRYAIVVFGLPVVAAQAGEYPNRPIRMIVPYPSGGGVDQSARILGEKLGNILGQQIVIESKPGASGMLGVSLVAKAPADGYTLLFSPGDAITIASLKPHVDVDVGTQLLPIAMINSSPMLVVATVKAPFGTVKEMVEAGKASPHRLEYGTPGRGTCLTSALVGQNGQIE